MQFLKLQKIKPMSELIKSGNGIGAITPPEWFTRSKASKRIGRSIDTLKRWQKLDILIPSGNMPVGKLIVWLYSEEDIQKGMLIKDEQKPGRKKAPEKKKKTTRSSTSKID